jgi:nucleoid-associated protein Lsr2
MAQKVLVQLVDDIDGHSGDDVSTIQFGLDGVTYEIDLNEPHAERLRGELSDYVGVARRVGGRIKRGTKPQSGSSAEPSEAGLIRQWGNANGFTLSNRGRIPGNVIDAYRQAQAAENKTSARGKARRPASAGGRARAKAS